MPIRAKELSVEEEYLDLGVVLGLRRPDSMASTNAPWHRGDLMVLVWNVRNNRMHGRLDPEIWEARKALNLRLYGLDVPQERLWYRSETDRIEHCIDAIIFGYSQNIAAYTGSDDVYIMIFSPAPKSNWIIEVLLMTTISRRAQMVLPNFLP